MIAANKGHANTVNMLIAKGANVNGKNNIGNTPLILSVLADNVASVKLLLDAGADADARNNKREQAIHIAELSNNTRIIDVLREHDEGKGLLRFF